MSRRSRSRRRPPQDPFEVTIDDLSHDGRGVAAWNEKKVFIHGALPGERVSAKLTGRKRRFDEGEVLEVLTPSKHRTAPRCPHFGQCGGCSLQHLEEAEQIRAKQNTLMQNLERIGKVVPEQRWDPITGPSWGYRRKARLSVRYVHKKERVLVGFREQNGRFVADMNECHVLDERIAQQIPALSQLIFSMDARATIPQLEVACGDDCCALVVRHMEALTESDLDKLRAFAIESGIAILLQPKGPDTITCLEPKTLELSYRVPEYGIEMFFEASDFVQVNAEINQKMISRALELLDPNAEDRVLDLFCGLGNFTLPIASRAGAVVGIEGEPALVRRARENAGRNNLDRVQFFAADLNLEPGSAPWLREPYDKVLVDPPRSGAEFILPHIAASGARRVVYVSCHPASLARDAGILVHEYGFRLVGAGVMDMFPHTGHVESIALFERGN